MKHLFKLIILSSFLASSASSASEGFGGWYAGKFAGLRFAGIKDTATLAMPALNLNGNYRGRFVCVRGAEGGSSLGYGFHLEEGSPFYLGGEASYSLTQAVGGSNYADVPFHRMGPVTFISGNMGQALSIRDVFGLGIRIGYAVKTSVAQFMPYIKLGVENAGFKTHLSLNEANVLNAVKLSLGTAKWCERRTAPSVGVGLDVKLTDNIIFGLNGSYTYYNDQGVSTKQITTTITAAQAAQIAAAAAGTAVGPLPAAGDQITTTVTTKPVMSRSVVVNFKYLF